MLHATHVNQHEPMIPITNLLNTFNPHTLKLHDQLLPISTLVFTFTSMTRVKANYSNNLLINKQWLINYLSY